MSSLSNSNGPVRVYFGTVTLSVAKGLRAKPIRRSRTDVPEHQAPAVPPSASHGDVSLALNMTKFSKFSKFERFDV